MSIDYASTMSYGQAWPDERHANSSACRAMSWGAMATVKKSTACWIAGGLALAGGMVALGVTVNWGLAAIVGGLTETAYFGILPLALARRKEAGGGTGESQATIASGPSPPPVPVTGPRPAPAAAPPPGQVTGWSDELANVLDTLVISLPEIIDIDQVAVQAGIAPHLISHSGDKASNRWQELIDRALIDGGDDQLDHVLTRAIRRSGSDPRLVAAVDQWRQIAHSK
jgi:hypothetical protein